jgi:endo-beta-N-acetylglucosaminidase D
MSLIQGTVICEWDAGRGDVLRLIYGPKFNPLLPSTFMAFCPIYADILCRISEYYGFDGWLINIECSLFSAIECLHLTHFLQYLRHKLNQLNSTNMLIFYDSITNSGKLDWQDCLNDQNDIYFKSTDGLFTNYSWKENGPSKSEQLAGERRMDVFTGIDCWGRGTFGGGGFNVHKALRSIAEKTSIALFAPAWTFEYAGSSHFDSYQTRLWVDSKQTIELPRINLPEHDSKPKTPSTWPDTAG